MDRKKTLALPALLFLLAAVLLSGCGKSEGSGSQPAQSPAVNDAGTGAAVDAAANDPAVTAAPLSAAEGELFTTRDLTQTADLSEATTITVADGETATVSDAGVYVLTGSANNACVVVEAGDEDKVQLVLNGVSIVNTDRPCILVESADKVFLTSAEGSDNTFAVSGSFGGEEDAAIFSRNDLVLNGLGRVTVASSKDGVRTNDDLKLTGGAWNVTSAGSALKAHDSVSAYDGVYELTAGTDGIHAEDNDDDAVGSIVIQGGSFTVQAGDDGIHATTSITVNGASLSISAAEGIEATQVVLNAGTVSIRAADDGVNAGRKSKSMGVKIEINGGEITIAMGPGDTDALDSNGDLIITGGTIDITARSPFDYDGSCSYTGGTIIVNGTVTDSVTNQMMGGPMGGAMEPPTGRPMGGTMEPPTDGSRGGFGGKH